MKSAKLGRELTSASRSLSSSIVVDWLIDSGLAVKSLVLVLKDQRRFSREKLFLFGLNLLGNVDFVLRKKTFTVPLAKEFVDRVAAHLWITERRNSSGHFVWTKNKNEKMFPKAEKFLRWIRKFLSVNWLSSICFVRFCVKRKKSSHQRKWKSLGEKGKQNQAVCSRRKIFFRYPSSTSEVSLKRIWCSMKNKRLLKRF